MGNGRPKNTPESFWRRVDRRGPDECWPWKIATKNGYGRFSLNCVEFYSHRYAYALTYGPPPEGRETHVMHSCNNKRCCNPAHLSLGTAAENTQAAFDDGLIKVRKKYSDEFIRTIFNDPRPQMELQRVYGVKQGYISSIKLGKIRRSATHG